MFSFVEHHSERVLCQILNSVLIHTWHCPVEVLVVWSVISQHTGTGVSQVKLVCSLYPQTYAGISLAQYPRNLGNGWTSGQGAEQNPSSASSTSCLHKCYSYTEA